jgi:hypothetical protein
MFLLTVFSVAAFFSPPFLLFFAWNRLVQPSQTGVQAKWRRVLDWVSLPVVSALWVAFLAMFFTNNCNADRGDWSCVGRWLSFAGPVVRGTPVLILLGILGTARVRIFVVLCSLAIAFDCVLVDMMR